MTKANSWTVPKVLPTKRIEGPDGQYIVIQKLSQGEKDERSDLLASMELKGKDEKQLAKLNLGSLKSFERKKSIKEWNLAYDDGTPVPLGDLSNVPDAVIEAIDKAIEELNPDKLSDEKKN